MDARPFDQDLQPMDLEALRRGLEKVAERESQFAEAFYDLFFEGCPEAAPLFGAYSFPERDHMLRETLGWLLALTMNEDWLENSILAHGATHHGYGVTEKMYGAYCESFADCARKVVGKELSETEANALWLGVTQISQRMLRASPEAETARSSD